MKAMGSQSSGGVLMSSSHRSWLWKVEGLELGLLEGEIWDRKRGRNSWQGEFEELSDAAARTIITASVCSQASPGQCEKVRNQWDFQKPWSLYSFQKSHRCPPNRRFRLPHQYKLNDISQNPLYTPLAVLFPASSAPFQSCGSPRPLISHGIWIHRGKKWALSAYL